jgi:hypothetical protein
MYKLFVAEVKAFRLFVRTEQNQENLQAVYSLFQWDVNRLCPEYKPEAISLLATRYIQDISPGIKGIDPILSVMISRLSLSATCSLSPRTASSC